MKRLDVMTTVLRVLLLYCMCIILYITYHTISFILYYDVIIIWLSGDDDFFERETIYTHL